GCYWFNHAFQAYHAGQYAQVYGDVVRAMRKEASYRVNRGLWRILYHSLVPLGRPKLKAYPQAG
ncbi:MAG: hypothetical protein M3Q45_15670, partial [Chloroflexota bacterium]|nr:hypothetical protein [Chloroflexota bacterium]